MIAATTNNTQATATTTSSSSLQHQQHNLNQDHLDQAESSDTELELDEFGEPLVMAHAHQLHHQHQQHQQHHANNNNNNSASSPSNNSSSSFLMDKNKKLFPQKLWELINNPSIQHCLRWSEDGQRVYLNRNEFEAYYLKTPNNQFHTQKAISFVRQMNMYGFRKVDDCYYENDNFRRDQQHLLRNMIRRHPNKGLFVTLDHHQLAAAAAAQAQALQVNQHLLQLEQQHKQRAEQALRLSNYLNGAAHHLSSSQNNATQNNGSSTSNHANAPNSHPSQQQTPGNHHHHQQQHHHHSLTTGQSSPVISGFQHALAAHHQHPLAHHAHQHHQHQQLHHSHSHNQHQQHPASATSHGHQHQQSAAAAAALNAAAVMQHQHHQLQHLHQQQQHQHHQHSSFDRISSQLAAQMAAAQKLQLQHQQHQLAADIHNQQQQHLTKQQHQATIEDKSIAGQQQQRNSTAAPLQPKKSRLLNDFYASLASSRLLSQQQQQQLVAPAIQNQQERGQHNVKLMAGTRDHLDSMMNDGDSMHSSSSSGLESRCSSALASGSLESSPGNSAASLCPTSNSASVNQQRLAAVLAAAAAAAADSPGKQPVVASSGQLPTNLSAPGKQQRVDGFDCNDLMAATNLAKQHQLIASSFGTNFEQNNNDHSQQQQQQQQALHETLVRSLLQLKHRQQQSDSMAFQHHSEQQQKSLLESLASLSSAGAGSITERSPSPIASSNHSRDLDCSMVIEENMALNLAKPNNSSEVDKQNQHQHHYHQRHHLQQEVISTTCNEIKPFKQHDSSSNGENSVKSNNNNNEKINDNHGDQEGENDDDDDEGCGVDVDEVDELNDRPRSQNGMITEHSNSTKDNGDGIDNEHRSENNKQDSSRTTATTNINNNNDLVSCSIEDQSPLDGTKKVKKYLDDHHQHHQEQDHPVDMMTTRRAIKRELDATNHINAKRARLADLDDELELEDTDEDLMRSSKRLAATQLGINWLSRTLIVQLCDRRGDKLDMEALGDAARYIECFLETLFDDAALIARHQSSSTGENSPESHTSSKDKSTSGADFTSTNPIDSSSLSLALKLIPSKLMASIRINCCQGVDGIDDEVSGGEQRMKQAEQEQHNDPIINSASPTTNESSQSEQDEVDICTASPNTGDHQNDDDDRDIDEC